MFKTTQLFFRRLETFARKQVRKQRIAAYLRSDRRPWRPGYIDYQEEYLEKVLQDTVQIEDFRQRKQLPPRYGLRLGERVIEIPWALAHLASRNGWLLDAGSSLNHDFVLKSQALANFQVTIMTLAPEAKAYWNLGVSYVFGDLRNLYFRDEWFDSIVCISTIEHIGMDNSIYTKEIGPDELTKGGNKFSADTNSFEQAITEFRRVLKPGGVLYITFPFGKYENHGWFQQYDGQLTDYLIRCFAPAHINETIFRYDPDGWKISDRNACSECEYFDVHKSKYFDPTSEIEYPPDYPAGPRAVACLELQK